MGFCVLEIQTLQNIVKCNLQAGVINISMILHLKKCKNIT